MGLTVVSLIDTDSDPDVVDLPIPGNDDSIRSIELILGKLADAVLEGRAALPADQQALVKPRQPAPAVSNGPNVPVAPNPKPAAPVVQS
jgi:small subunit ribosomal protein S2